MFLSGWNSIQNGKHSRDFATYYYANHVTQQNQNPYETSQLSLAAQQQRTRKSVHPFFYPPPAILFFTWTSLFSLFTSYQIFFVLNQICMAGILYFGRKWLQISWLYLLLLICTFTPLQNSMVMGQVNIFVVLFLLIALRYNNGFALACAGMIKMSPVYIMFQWIVQKRWKATIQTIIGAVILSMIALLIMKFQTQISFYVDVLPSFASGNYNGLQVPITLPANHSIPDIWNQIFAGKDNHTLSEMAKRISSVISISMLAIILVCSKYWKGEVTSRMLYGASITLFVITPVYTYEHHLAFIVIPLMFVMEAWTKYQRKNTYHAVLLMMMYVALAIPLWMLRSFQGENDIWNWMVQESKFFALLFLFFNCLFLAHRYRENSLDEKID